MSGTAWGSGWRPVALPLSPCPSSSLSQREEVKKKKKKADKTRAGIGENRGRGGGKGFFTTLASFGGEVGQCAVCVTNSS